MVFDSRLFTSGSAFGRADCSLALSTFARVLRKDSPEGCWVFWKQKVQPAAWPCPRLEWVAAEAGVWREVVSVALVRLALETSFLTLSEIASSCFLFNCLLSALHFFFFFFSLFSCVSFLFPPLPTSLGLGCVEAAPTGGRRHPSLPGGTRTPSLRRPEGGKAVSCCNLLTRSFYRAASGFFSVILCKKQEVADCAAILGGTEKVLVCLGVLDQNPGVFVCLGMLVENPAEIWNASNDLNTSNFYFICLCCNQEQNLARYSLLIAASL